MSDTIITVVGNLTADPELRFTPSGAGVANFTIASTPRKFNKQANDWEDGETLFLRASIWREAAENVSESLTKGTRVVAQGKLKARSYEDKKTGEKRTSYELDVDEIGPSLRYATAKVTKKPSGGFGGNNGGGNTAPAGGNFGGQSEQWGGGQQSAGNWGAPTPSNGNTPDPY